MTDLTMEFLKLKIKDEKEYQKTLIAYKAVVKDMTKVGFEVQQELRKELQNTMAAMQEQMKKDMIEKDKLQE